MPTRGRLLFYGAGFSGAFAVAEVLYRETSGGANVATGGTASASSFIAGYPPALAFDGVLTGGVNTSFAVNVSQGAWLAYDFGVNRDVIEIVIYPRSDASFAQAPTTLVYQTSSDNITWADRALLRPAAWASGVPQTFTIPSAATWEVFELFIRSPRSGGYATLGEVSLHNGGANLIIGATASASSVFNVDTPASRALDAGASIYPWHSLSGAPHWWRATLGAGLGIAVPSTITVTSRNDTSTRNEDVADFFLCVSNGGNTLPFVMGWYNFTLFTALGQSVNLSLTSSTTSVQTVSAEVILSSASEATVQTVSAEVILSSAARARVQSVYAENIRSIAVALALKPARLR